MTFLDLLGVASGVMFAWAAVPAAIATAHDGRSIGIPISLAWFILSGCALLYIYLIGKFGFDWIVTFNLGVETAAYLVIMRYHYWPRRRLS